jgi:hypothetical protein
VQTDGDRAGGIRLVVCFVLALALGMLAGARLDWPWPATLAISTGTVVAGFLLERRKRGRMSQRPRR